MNKFGFLEIANTLIVTITGKNYPVIKTGEGIP